MTFDESNARLTESFHGRTINYVVRNGKQLEFHTECGHVIKLQSDIDHDIHFVSQGVSIQLTGVSMLGSAGKF